MDVGLLDVGLLLDAEPDLKVTALVVGTVGARDQLLELSLVGEPSFKIKLLGSCIVEGAGDNGNHTVRDSEGLIELLRVGDHVLKHLPRLLGLGNAELLDLGELVDAENAPNVPAMGTGLLAEAGRVTGVLQGEITGLQPLIAVEGADRLLGGCNKVLVGLVAGDLVELLIELGELGRLGHLLSKHELGRLKRNVVLVRQELEAVVNQSPKSNLSVCPRPFPRELSSYWLRNTPHFFRKYPLWPTTLTPLSGS